MSSVKLSGITFFHSLYQLPLTSTVIKYSDPMETCSLLSRLPECMNHAFLDDTPQPVGEPGLEHTQARPDSGHHWEVENLFFFKETPLIKPKELDFCQLEKASEPHSFTSHFQQINIKLKGKWSRKNKKNISRSTKEPIHSLLI